MRVRMSLPAASFPGSSILKRELSVGDQTIMGKPSQIQNTAAPDALAVVGRVVVVGAS
jgi:hypothetical protein